MAKYQAGAQSTVDDFISQLNTFLAANGWTIDFFGTYNSHNRLHAHKSTSHFEIWYYTASVVYVAGCTGYSAGQAPTAQPGVSPTPFFWAIYNTPNTYLFVSVDEGVYILTNTGGYKGMMFLGDITEKTSAWTGGQFISGQLSTGNHLIISGTANSNASLFLNGSWTPIVASNAASGVTGLYGSFALSSKQPNAYNAGLLMLPIRIFQRDATTAALLRPLGYFPSLRGIRGGKVYAFLEEVVIGSDTWLFYDDSMATNTEPTLMFKLAA
jgi:hypothetical protein